MAGLLNAGRQAGAMNPRRRRADESVFANRQDADGDFHPADLPGRSPGDAAFEKRPPHDDTDEALPAAPGQYEGENSYTKGSAKKARGLLNAGADLTIDRSVQGRADGDFASQSGGNGVQGEGYMTPAEVAAGGKQTVRQTGGVNFSTEKTISVESDGKHYVLPTIVNGKSYTPGAAVKEFVAGKIKPLGIFDNPEHAESFARQRSADLDAAFNGGHGFLRKGPSSPADGQMIGTNGPLNSPTTPQK